MDKYQQDNVLPYRAVSSFCKKNTKHDRVFAYGADEPSRSNLLEFAQKHLAPKKGVKVYVFSGLFLVADFPY